MARSKRDQIYLIDVFLQMMAPKLKYLQRLTNICPAEAGNRRQNVIGKKLPCQMFSQNKQKFA